MTKAEFRAITIADVPAMAELLLSRQMLERDTFPFLQNCCLNTVFLSDVLEKLLTEGDSIGMGMFNNGKLIGYLIGAVKTDSSRGRHIWVPYEGLAVRADQPPELIRALYAKTSAAWLVQGCFMHYILIPLGNQVYLETLQRLSFFIQQVHGVMDLGQYRPFEQVSDAEVRMADRSDGEKMGRLSGIIQSYQNSAPTFEPVLPEIAADIRAGYESTVEDSGLTVLLAEKNGMELGFHLYEDIAPGLMSPDGGAELSVAGTYPGHMGAGVGKRLMNEGCSLMRARGVRHIVTDWRIANLASSTFWPKCGFQPVAYRMVRYIDSNWSPINSGHSGIKKMVK